MRRRWRRLLPLSLINHAAVQRPSVPYEIMSHNSKGYEQTKIPGHPLAQKSGYVMVHRLVWFESNGPIPEDHVIHHKNGDRKDNRLENLELHSRSSHGREHWAESGLDCAGKAAEMAQAVCAFCGKEYPLKAWKVRQGIKRGWKSCCSMKCRSAFARLHRWPRALKEVV